MRKFDFNTLLCQTRIPIRAQLQAHGIAQGQVPLVHESTGAFVGR